MRLILCIICYVGISITVAKAQVFNQGNCPNNIDFELGNFNNWLPSTGTTFNGPTYTWGANGVQPNIHTIFSATANAGFNDAYGNFPVVCPNGSGYSVMLGNATVGVAKAQRLTYIFTIPVGSIRYSLTYFYAAVLNQGAASNHTDANQARFTVNLLDLTVGAPVNCTSFDYNASGGESNGFVKSPINSQVFYKNWTPVTVDLSGLNGRTISLEFVTNNCAPSGHFGYAYIDVGATCITPVTGYAYCAGAASLTLTAPFGYQNYFWYDATNSATLGNNQTLTLSPPPPNGTIFNVDLVPFPFGGCRDTLPVIIEEQVPPDTPVTGSDVAYCQYDVATQLQATVLPGYLAVWYTTPTGGTALSAAPTPNTGTIGVTFYYVSQRSFGGCEGPRKAIRVEILGPPIADFTINDTIQCFPNHSFAFTNTSTNVGPTTIYTWDFGDGSPTITGPNATHSYANLNTYTVTLTVQGGNNCIVTKQIPVQVVAAPIANFNVANACAGSTFNFLNTTIGGSAQNVYSWNFGGGLTSTATSPTVTLPFAGTVNVQLTVTESGCTHDTTKPVIVHPNPVSDFTVSSTCFGDSASFTPTATVATGSIIGYTWVIDGATYTIPNPKVKFATSGANSVKLTVTTNNNCSKDTTKTVLISEKPIAKFIQADTACLNAPVQLLDASTFATNVTNSSVATWWWSTGNGNNYTSQNVTTIYNTTQASYTVQQVVTSNYGCVSDTNTQTVAVKALPLPIINISNPICATRLVTFTDATPNSKSRTWALSNGLTNQQKVWSTKTLQAGAASVTLQVIDSFGCTSNITNQNIIANPKPTFTFAYQDSCIDRAVPFTANDLTGTIVTWVWSFNGVNESGGSTKTHTFAKVGKNDIALYGVAATGCISDTAYKSMVVYETNAYAGLDVKAGENEPIQLLATGGQDYVWTPSTGLNSAVIYNPIARLLQSQLYTVKVTDTRGCIDYDDVNIVLYKGPEIYVPTIFTPNNDGVNDVLTITPIGIAKLDHFIVYNRWGKVMYSTQNAGFSWNGTYNGKLLQQDTYVWVASGTDIKGAKIVKKGTVILAR